MLVENRHSTQTGIDLASKLVAAAVQLKSLAASSFSRIFESLLAASVTTLPALKSFDDVPGYHSSTDIVDITMASLDSIAAPLEIFKAIPRVPPQVVLRPSRGFPACLQQVTEWCLSEAADAVEVLVIELEKTSLALVTAFLEGLTPIRGRKTVMPKLRQQTIRLNGWLRQGAGEHRYHVAGI